MGLLFKDLLGARRDFPPPHLAAKNCHPNWFFCKSRSSQVSNSMAKPRTLYDKIWDDHLVHTEPDGVSLIYIDRHLVHEVTSPQAFEGLRLSGRSVRAPQKTLAV